MEAPEGAATAGDVDPSADATTVGATAATTATATTAAAAAAAQPAAPSLEDWPVADDFLLRESVEAGAALGAIARGILPFSRPYSRDQITERWR